MITARASAAGFACLAHVHGERRREGRSSCACAACVGRACERRPRGRARASWGRCERRALIASPVATLTLAVVAVAVVVTAGSGGHQHRESRRRKRRVPGTAVRRPRPSPRRALARPPFAALRLGPGTPRHAPSARPTAATLAVQSHRHAVDPTPRKAQTNKRNRRVCGEGLATPRGLRMNGRPSTPDGVDLPPHPRHASTS